MAMMIRKAPLAQPQRRGKPQKDGDYLAFIRKLPCCVTGVYGRTEAAHLSMPSTLHGHYGRGKGTKVSDRWALPLSHEEHIEQHSMNEMDYWVGKRFLPHVLCLVLWGLWTEMGDDALPFAEAVIRDRTRT